MDRAAEKIAQGLHYGFIDSETTALEQYAPRLIVNNYKEGIKVLSTIEAELRECTEFYFSVAFITNSGVQSIVNLLDMLEAQGIKGKIITSQYQNFTQPRALRRLLKYKNIDLRIVTEGNFHAKGYIFRKKDGTFSFLIGSSNLTQNALSENKEWNIRLSASENGFAMRSLVKEFRNTFNEAEVVDEAWIHRYEREYYYMNQLRKAVEKTQKQGQVIRVNQITPNKMQKEALNELEKLRMEGKEKGLLISATGTGKTYLSAFDVQVFAPKKFLFVAHRENIARAARRSFENVLGYNLNAGFMLGSSKDFDCDYMFATIQTISKPDIMERFGKEHFDYIVIDEVHKAGASSYQRIIEYFQPKFLLGMTATPERTDGLSTVIEKVQK
ncbi:DEAD/DEAH box helicase family protein [Emergencia sp. 1XD21-10]|uniref:DEAD/DEAH box helicase family protein n=1 Tax=Emergencia sp. 1XD21-10 TaxID=2304569 RepID=UPI00137B7BDE|nr:DEAD/DEAH box helicase family protein [Emergencia sp. 1XD21-10]NCE98216.1 NgoFVII family restriction endonuclease [Emergencia sp. 1XD21-10]